MQRRYFFHIRDGGFVWVDDEGMEFGTPREADAYGARIAVEIGTDDRDYDDTEFRWSTRAATKSPPSDSPPVAALMALGDLDIKAFRNLSTATFWRALRQCSLGSWLRKASRRST